jgi:hypothetical protein
MPDNVYKWLRVHKYGLVCPPYRGIIVLIRLNGELIGGIEADLIDGDREKQCTELWQLNCIRANGSGYEVEHIGWLA